MTLTFEYKPCTRSTKGDKFNHPSPPTSLCYLNNCPSPPYLLYSPGRFGTLSWLYFSMFTIDDVISFFWTRIIVQDFAESNEMFVTTPQTSTKKKKNDFRSKLSIFVRIFDPCDEIVKCLGLSTNMKICFRHNRCQYWGFEYVIICVVLNREMHRIEIICYIPWFPFKQMSWKDS